MGQPYTFFESYQMFTKEPNVPKCNQRLCYAGIIPEPSDALWVKSQKDALMTQGQFLTNSIFAFVSPCYCLPNNLQTHFILRVEFIHSGEEC